MARTTIGTLASLLLVLGLSGCGSSQRHSGEGLVPPVSNGAPPSAPAPACPVGTGPSCPAPAAPCPPAPTQTCGGGDDTSDPAPSDPAPSDPSDPSSGNTTASSDESDLVVEVTNTSDVTIDVTAQTPDESVDCGLVAPGETISVDLSELPTSATLSATAQGADSSGDVPTFDDDTLELGSDYTDAAPVASIAWSDPTDPSSNDPGSAGGDDSGGSDQDGTADPDSTVRRTSSGTFLAHAAPFAPKVRKVTPKIVKHATS